MSTETEIVEVKEEKIASPDNAPAENQYKIFDYFKEHTGLLVTCMSALVAIMSFILHFAVGRMNYTSESFLLFFDFLAMLMPDWKERKKSWTLMRHPGFAPACKKG